MQKDSTLPCFVMYGEQTAQHLRDRFQPTLTHSLIGEYVDRLIDTSLGSNWTRLYDSVSQKIIYCGNFTRLIGTVVSILFPIHLVATIFFLTVFATLINDVLFFPKIE